ncbi:hypothetical protein PsorP6_004813 [Peronosclerospora sorghi]|uniref:Uncharacterized protein n=1 Tax=Peronosclerospora sorghi TaxID=230839 RepID=A0ACC0VP42_9STRA|nr:hypothetical protein PsorP6_004813 [Peronosclerospora sorghi]
MTTNMEEHSIQPPMSTAQGFLEHDQFPHLTGIKWSALGHLSQTAGVSVVTTLLRSGNPEAHRLAAHEFMELELEQAVAKAQSTLAPPPSVLGSPPINIDVSCYAGNERAPLRCFTEIDSAISAMKLVDSKAQDAFMMSKLSGREIT